MNAGLQRGFHTDNRNFLKLAGTFPPNNLSKRII